MEDPTELSRRLKDLRERVFGPRGRARFARAIGVSPSTYNYYEKARQPPADLLARAAEVAGASLEWLLTGRGDPFPVASDTTLSQSSHEIARRFAQAVGAAGESAAVRVALQALLGQIEAFSQAKKAPWSPAVLESTATQVPVVGRTAAGLLAAWDDLLAGDADSGNLERLIRQAEGRAGRTRPGDLVAADPREEPLAPSDAPPMLVQLSEPTPDGVVEFVDLATLGPAVHGAFALRVDGSSMSPRILDGDLVVSRRDAAPRPGETALVKRRGHVGVTVKLWRPEGDVVHLVPINEAFEPSRVPLSDILWACRVLWVVRL